MGSRAERGCVAAVAHKLVSAERCGSAALDRRHDLQLPQAQRANFRTARMYPAWVCGASLRIRMSSVMRWRNGEILLEEFMVLLRVTDEADCLNCQATEQSLSAHLPARRRIEATPYRASGLVR